MQQDKGLLAVYLAQLDANRAQKLLICSSAHSDNTDRSTVNRTLNQDSLGLQCIVNTCHTKLPVLQGGLRVRYALALLQLRNRTGGTNHILCSCTVCTRLNLYVATDIPILPIPSDSCAVCLIT